jgi:hypothetical protein
MNRNEHAGQISESNPSPRWRMRQWLGGILPAQQAYLEETLGGTRLLTLAALAVMVLITVAPVRAQDEMLIAHIPFSFRVGSATLPPGNYTLQHQDDGQQFWAVQSNRFNGGVFAPVSTEGSNDIWKYGSLVFYRYGNTYFLSQIRYPGRRIKCRYGRPNGSNARSPAITPNPKRSMS